VAASIELVSTDWLRDVLAEVVTDDGPGAAIGVYTDGELVGSAARGLASVEHRVPITVHSIFDIASVSKQITATCVALLQRDGALRLDDDVRRFVPELSLRRPVTLRQCAQHTGGLRDYLSLVEAVGAPLASVALEPDFLRVVAPVEETNFLPGTDISYSNTGYVLLATVVSRVTGDSFQRFARERVFEPLGMGRSQFRDGLGFVMADLASSYEATDGGYRRADLAEALVGDGATLTCVSDLAHWHGFLLDGRGLGTDIRDEIVTPAVLADGRVCGYGLGVRLGRLDGRPMLWHGGAMYGFGSELLCLPDSGVGVSVLTNRDDVPVGDIARRVAREALGVPQPSAAAPAAGGPAVPDLAGSWVAADADQHLVVRPEPDGDLLIVSGEEEDRYTHRGAGVWELREYARLERHGGTGDQLRWSDHAGRVVHYRRPIAGIEPPADLLVGRYSSTELEADIVVRAADDVLTIELARTGAHPLTYVETDGGDVLYAAGLMTVRLRPSEQVLFASGADLQRLRFARVDGPTCPVAPAAAPPSPIDR
jgi:CubicO group peptidase (beta-lactamase class C family)